MPHGTCCALAQLQRCAQLHPRLFQKVQVPSVRLRIVPLTAVRSAGNAEQISHGFDGERTVTVFRGTKHVFSIAGKRKHAQFLKLSAEC